MRDRLIELMQDWGNKNTDSFPFESVAEYLLENGVLVAPMKMSKELTEELMQHINKRVVDEL